MDRNKRNSIAAIPTRTDRLHDDYDGNAGGGATDMVTGRPLQVSSD